MTLRRNHAGVSKAASYTVRRKAEPRELCSWPKRPPLAAQSQNSPSSRRRQKQYQSAAGLRGGHQVAVPAPAGERHLVAALEAVAAQHELGVQHGGGAVAEAQAHALPGADGADGPPVALAGRVVGDVGLK